VKVNVGTGLLIGIPTLGRPIPMQWAFAHKSMHPPINYNSSTILLEGKPVDEARNEIAAHAIRLGAKYLFFLGDDVVPPANTLKQLIYRLEQNPNIGVVGGVYCSKSDPPCPLIFRGNGVGAYWDWKVGEFIEVTGLGMDATLIRVDVLKQLIAKNPNEPLFKTVDVDQFDEGINHADQWTEDLFFCKRVLEETDYKIFVDTSLLCDHYELNWSTRQWHKFNVPVNSLPTRRLESPKGRKALDIGCGPIDRSNEFPDFDLVRVDIREEVNPDYRCDVRNLPFGGAEFDLVFSSHVLEHISRDEWENTLNEWVRVLKPEGELILCLPNIEWAIEHRNEPENLDHVLNVFYGAQSNPYDFHYNGFWPERLKNHLTKLGFKIVGEQHHGYNMMINARR
jgi:SAM-dependent methyltransferase